MSDAAEGRSAADRGYSGYEGGVSSRGWGGLNSGDWGGTSANSNNSWSPKDITDEFGDLDAAIEKQKKEPAPPSLDADQTQKELDDASNKALNAANPAKPSTYYGSSWDYDTLNPGIREALFDATNPDAATGGLSKALRDLGVRGIGMSRDQWSANESSEDKAARFAALNAIVENVAYAAIPSYIGIPMRIAKAVSEGDTEKAASVISNYGLNAVAKALGVPSGVLSAAIQGDFGTAAAQAVNAGAVNAISNATGIPSGFINAAYRGTSTQEAIGGAARNAVNSVTGGMANTSTGWSVGAIDRAIADNVFGGFASSKDSMSSTGDASSYSATAASQNMENMMNVLQGGEGTMGSFYTGAGQTYRDPSLGPASIGFSPEYSWSPEEFAADFFGGTNAGAIGARNRDGAGTEATETTVKNRGLGEKLVGGIR